MSLLRSRSSPVWVIDPRSVLSPVECSRGDQTQKSSQLADIFKLSPIADPCQKLAGHDPADAGKRHHIFNALGQFGIGLAKAADLFGRLKDLFLGKLQTVKQLIELKAHRVRTGKLSKLCLHEERPLTAWPALEERRSLRRATAI